MESIWFLGQSQAEKTLRNFWGDFAKLEWEKKLLNVLKNGRGLSEQYDRQTDRQMTAFILLISV
jgi:hypothetical protein